MVVSVRADSTGGATDATGAAGGETVSVGAVGGGWDSISLGGSIDAAEGTSIGGRAGGAGSGSRVADCGELTGAEGTMGTGVGVACRGIGGGIGASDRATTGGEGRGGAVEGATDSMGEAAAGLAGG